MKLDSVTRKPAASISPGKRRSWPRWWLVMVAVVMSAASVAAVPGQGGAPAGVRVSLVPDSTQLTVGDPVTLSLIISHPADYSVAVPRLEREWGPFEVQAQTSVQTVSIADGIRTVAKQFRVTLFAPGAFETPVLPVSVRGPDGTVTRVSPGPVQLTVNSVLSSPDDELKDLRPLADLSTPFWERRIVLALMVVLALGLLGATAFILHRRLRGIEEPAGGLPDLRTPWEVAVQEMDRIASLDLPVKGEMKEHYTLVAAALRTYLGATYLRDTSGGNAGEMSTEEIAAGIRQSELDLSNAGVVIELLEEADLVKFANHEPSVAQANQAAVQVRNVVEATRPVAVGARGAASPTQGAAP